MPQGRDDTYDYPELQKIIRSRADFRGVRLVEARSGGSKIVAAIVRSRCQADKLVAAMQKELRTNPWSRCKQLDVTRVIM
ncbi:MAG: hypothetical protein HY744_01210, partial [Deltaproteobacteria bacterium]|nr:hypothetical protein [Deltaproteobacteria bacterium]